MTGGRSDQRRSRRFPCSIPVVVWVGKRRLETETSDVSRHGMFLRIPDGPQERFLVKLEIQVPGTSLEATAFVTRRVPEGPRAGVGVQLFALSSQAKSRWDGFVSSLAGSRDVQSWSPSRTSGLPADSATFLIKLRDVKRLMGFFDRNIRSGTVFMNTPVLRDPGSAVAMIIIHPDSEREFLISGRVKRVSLEPKGMELSLDPVTAKLERRFNEFVETGRPSDSMDLLLHPERSAPDLMPAVQQTEAAAQPPPPAPEPPPAPLEPTADEEPDGFHDPLAFEVDSQTGDLTLDIEIDEASLDELQVFDQPPEPAVPLLPRPPPLEVVTVRCTACGTFLGPVDVAPLPDAIEWVAERQTFYDRFAGRFEHRVDPKPPEELERGEKLHAEDVVPAELLFRLAAHWNAYDADPPRGPNFEPHLRQVAEELLAGHSRRRLGLACPICSEKQLFASVD